MTRLKYSFGDKKFKGPVEKNFLKVECKIRFVIFFYPYLNVVPKQLFNNISIMKNTNICY
jgi:hypothetical protein